MILLLRNVTVPPSTGNFNISCAVDGMARIFLIPSLPIIPLCWDGDLTTMKFIHAEVECSSSPIFTSKDIWPSGQMVSPLKMLTLRFSDTFKMRKLRLFQLFKDRLNEDRHTLFKTTCFEPWLDIIYVENDDGMIYYVLQKQCCSDDDNFDLPLIYHVNCHSLHFGRREFCLLTGFEFGSISFREYMNGDIPFRNWLFPEKTGYDVKIIDLFALFDDEEKFFKLSDEDAIRLCLLLSLEHIWRQLYDSIRNVSSKHKLEHLAGLKRNPNHVPSYSLTGYLFAFKIWIIESSCVSDRWWTKVSEIIPRALSWRRAASIELAPMKAEFQSNWYAPSYDFLCGMHQGAHLFPSKGCMVITLKTNCIEKDESLNIFVPQIEDFLKSTLEDEPDIKDIILRYLSRRVV
ncbi:hypothetical protein Tco_0168290 [Tanacetum coccineum]